MYKGFRCIAQWRTENEAEDQQIKKELENCQKEGLIRQLSTAWGGMSFQSFEMPIHLMCWLSIMHPALQFSLEWARMDLSEHGTRGYCMGRMTWAKKTTDPEMVEHLAREVIQEQSEEMYKIKNTLSEKVCDSWAAQQGSQDSCLHVTETIWEMLNDLRLDTEYAEYLNRLDDPLSEVRDQWLKAHPEDADPEVWCIKTKDKIALSGELDQLIERMQAQGMGEAQSMADSPMQGQSI